DWANTKPTVRKIRPVNPKGFSTAVKAYTPAAAGPPPVAEVVEFNDAGLKAGDKVEIAGVQYTLKDLAAGADPKKFEFNPAAPAGGWPAATAVRKVQGGENPLLANGAGRALYENALVELDNRTDKEVLSVSKVEGNEVTFSSIPTKQYFEGDSLRVIEA